MKRAAEKNPSHKVSRLEDERRRSRLQSWGEVLTEGHALSVDSAPSPFSRPSSKLRLGVSFSEIIILCSLELKNKELNLGEEGILLMYCL